MTPEEAAAKYPRRALTDDDARQIINLFTTMDEAQKAELWNVLRGRALKEIDDYTKTRILTNGEPVTNLGDGTRVGFETESYADILNFRGAVAINARENGRQFDISIGGGPCFDAYLDPDGSAVYPSTQMPDNRFSNLQALIDYAEGEGFTRAVTVWVCPNSSSYGNGTISTAFVDSGFAAVYTFSGAGTPSYTPSVNRLGIITVAATAIRAALNFTNITTGGIKLERPGVGETTYLYVPRAVNSALATISSIGAGAGATAIYDAVFADTSFSVGSAVELGVDSLIVGRFTACQVGHVHVKTIQNVEFDASCELDASGTSGVATYRSFLKITQSFASVTVRGRWSGWSDFSLPSTVVLFELTEADCAGMVISVQAESQVVGGQSLYFAVNNAGDAPIQVQVIGCANESVSAAAKGALGAFTDSTFGPCAPDDLDWSGVTGTGNVFYTTGSVPAGAPPVGPTPDIEQVLTAGDDAGGLAIDNLTYINGPTEPLGAGSTAGVADLGTTPGLSVLAGAYNPTFTPSAFLASPATAADGLAGVLTDGSTGGAGEVLTADGAGTATWEAAGAGSLTDHTHEATGSGATGGGKRTRPESFGVQPVAKTISGGLLTLSSPGESHVILSGEGAADDVLTDITAGADGDVLTLEWDGATAITVISLPGGTATQIRVDGGLTNLILQGSDVGRGRCQQIRLVYSSTYGQWLAHAPFHASVGKIDAAGAFTGQEEDGTQLLFYADDLAQLLLDPGLSSYQSAIRFPPADVTIATGLVTYASAGAQRTVLLVSGEGAAADTLAGVALASSGEGIMMIVRAADAAQPITITHNDVVEGAAGSRFFTKSTGSITLTAVTDSALFLWQQALDSGSGGWLELLNTVTSTKSVVGSVFSPDSDTATPQMLVGPMLQGGRITAVHAKTGHNLACGATSWIGDIHKILAANANTDGAGTTIFSTKPTIAVGDMYDDDAVVSVTTFAAGDWFAFYSDQHGSGLAEVGMTMEVIYA